MAPAKVTGVVWWEMQISHYKAVFRRAAHGEIERGYTKDLLQAPRAISVALRSMFDGDAPYEPITYRWPGGSYDGKIYPVSDRLEVGQWTSAGAPGPWRIGDSKTDPLVTLEGNPEASIPDEADAQWEILQESEPWLIMVQLDESQTELHLRAHLGVPLPHQLDAGLDRIPSALRQQMRDRGGLVAGDGLPELWFDPDDLRDPWRTTGDSIAGSTISPAMAVDASLGSEYRMANESVTSAVSEPFDVDPDERDRGTQAHAKTQNALSDVIRQRGFTPKSPKQGEPNYDVAWEEDQSLVVAEVKSVTSRNSEKQLRLALGQILRYRSLLEESGRTVKSVIALSDLPHDDRWIKLCQDYGVGLVWMPDLDAQLSQWLG